MDTALATLLLAAALMTPQQYAAQCADYYEVNPHVVYCILDHESDWDSGAIGDNGDAVGIAQFHLDTWIWMRGLMGADTADSRADPVEAIRTLCWAMANDLSSHWTAYRKVCCKQE